MERASQRASEREREREREREEPHRPEKAEKWKPKRKEMKAPNEMKPRPEEKDNYINLSVDINVSMFPTASN